MRLRWSPTSPYVRKVMVLAREKGIDGLLDLEKSNPLSREDRAATPNPLGKIPCLVTDDGMALYDSPVIMEYLDVHCPGPKMLAASGIERWTALRRQALADGMLEASVACFVESIRKPERQSGGWIAHNRANVFRAAAALEEEVPTFGDAVDIGLISIAVALSFAEQTFPDEDWRGSNPSLAAWHAAFAARSSMTETQLVAAGELG